VEDDGGGFDVEAALTGEALGLFEMRERAAAVGGTLTIDSRPGAGTRIRATVGAPRA
jgi:signal transduction histidine kinase